MMTTSQRSPLVCKDQLSQHRNGPDAGRMYWWKTSLKDLCRQSLMIRYEALMYLGIGLVDMVTDRGQVELLE